MQSLKYGKYLPYEALSAISDIQHVPFLGVHSFNLDELKEMAEGSSLVEGANHIREGIVVRPIDERWTNDIGRLQLKLISNAYLENE